MNIFIPNKLPGSGIIKIGAWKLYLENEATAHVGAVRLYTYLETTLQWTIQVQVFKVFTKQLGALCIIMYNVLYEANSRGCLRISNSFFIMHDHQTAWYRILMM